MIIVISEHAKQRFKERYPDKKYNLEQLAQRAYYYKRKPYYWIQRQIIEREAYYYKDFIFLFDTDQSEDPILISILPIDFFKK